MIAIMEKGAIALVVDDNLDSVANFKDILRDLMGFEVVCCSSGEDGMKLLKSQSIKPAVIITDINMPGMDGVEFASKSRKLFSPGEVIFFAYTGVAGREKELKDLNLFNGGVFMKTDTERLLDTIGNMAPLQ